MNKALFAQLQSVINYIEDNILETIKISDLTNLVFMSQSSFYNVCSLVLGMPIKRYIRQRKLSKSAYDLIYSNNNVLDIAIKYGYSTSASYSRSFKQLYGKSPQHYKNAGKYRNAFPKIVLIKQSIGGILVNRHEKNIAVLNNVLNSSTKGYLLDVDIDHFQIINDRFGTDIGDKVLVFVQESLNKTLKKCNIGSQVIRIAGDEFAIVINDIASKKLEQVCDYMISDVHQGFTEKTLFVPLSISIGISAISSDEKSNLIGEAQTAMLAAKKAGKNTYKFA